MLRSSNSQHIENSLQTIIITSYNINSVFMQCNSPTSTCMWYHQGIILQLNANWAIIEHNPSTQCQSRPTSGHKPSSMNECNMNMKQREIIQPQGISLHHHGNLSHPHHPHHNHQHCLISASSAKEHRKKTTHRFGVTTGNNSYPT